MLLFDVHAHLEFEDYENDLDFVLAECKKAGISFIINNGTDPKDNRKVQELAQKHPLLKAAYGFYPVHVAEEGMEAFDKELAWIRENKPVALGEIGLDYYVGDDNPHGDLHKELQQEAFRKFIALGKELDIPLIIHSRKAEQDVLDILEELGSEKVILHCFMGKKKLMQRAIDLGYTFSLPVSIIRSEQFQWLARNAPLGQVLTETDSPYMAPVRGERNSPKHVEITVKKIAELKGMDPEEVANQLYFNYQRLF